MKNSWTNIVIPEVKVNLVAFKFKNQFLQKKYKIPKILIQKLGASTITTQSLEEISLITFASFGKKDQEFWSPETSKICRCTKFRTPVKIEKFTQKIIPYSYVNHRSLFERRGEPFASDVCSSERCVLAMSLSLPPLLIHIRLNCGDILSILSGSLQDAVVSWNIHSSFINRT